VAPAAVQGAERFLDYVFGGGPVAEHDDRQPQELDGVGLIQASDRDLGARYRGLGPVSPGRGRGGAGRVVQRVDVHS